MSLSGARPMRSLSAGSGRTTLGSPAGGTSGLGSGTGGPGSGTGGPGSGAGGTGSGTGGLGSGAGGTGSGAGGLGSGVGGTGSGWPAGSPAGAAVPSSSTGLTARVGGRSGAP